jgi:hypothetical protein
VQETFEATKWISEKRDSVSEAPAKTADSVLFFPARLLSSTVFGFSPRSRFPGAPGARSWTRHLAPVFTLTFDDPLQIKDDPEGASFRVFQL